MRTGRMFHRDAQTFLVHLFGRGTAPFGAYDPYLTFAVRIPIFRVSEGDRKWRRKHPGRAIARD